MTRIDTNWHALTRGGTRHFAGYAFRGLTIVVLAAVPSVSAPSCLVFLVVVVPGCPKLTARPRGHECAAYLVSHGLIGAFRGLTLVVLAAADHP